jgi:hypothetical protein
VEVATKIDNTVLRREMLGLQAWHEVIAGNREGALIHIEAAAAITVLTPDPEGDVRLGVYHTDLLLIAGASADRILEAARAGLRASDTWDLDTNGVAVLRANVAEALVREGRIREAGAIVDAPTEAAVSVDRASIHCQRAWIDGLRGFANEAADRFASLAALPSTNASNHVLRAMLQAQADLWRGRPAEAWSVLHAAVERVVATEESRFTAMPFAVLARTAADLTCVGDARSAAQLHHDLHALHAHCLADPFSGDAVGVEHGAARATWDAELARLTSTETVEHWVQAATGWHRLGRPHEATYCRWRGAEVALRVGQAMLANRMLKRAARDAGEHVPLHRAVAQTAAYARAGKPRP